MRNILQKNTGTLTKLRNLNCDKSNKKIKLKKESNAQVGTELQILNCNKTQKLKWLQNSNCDKT